MYGVHLTKELQATSNVHLLTDIERIGIPGMKLIRLAKMRRKTTHESSLAVGCGGAGARRVMSASDDAVNKQSLVYVTSNHVLSSVIQTSNCPSACHNPERIPRLVLILSAGVAMDRLCCDRLRLTDYILVG